MDGRVVTEIVWLASYPKSGNTWLRILIANLFAADGRPVDINNLNERGVIASDREEFDEILMLDSGLLTPDEAASLRPRVHDEIAKGPGRDRPEDAGVGPLRVRFVKVHDAYTLTSGGEPLLAGRRGAKGAIVIVRDPRDIAASVANHYRLSIDDAVALLNDRAIAQAESRDSQPQQLRQKLLGWSGHIASWLDQDDIPVHLVRYEDLQSDAVSAFSAAMAFAGLSVSREDAVRTAGNSEFSKIRSQERDKGFREWLDRRDGEFFFRRGVAGGWRDELDIGQVKRIEAANAAMMRRLGYELTASNDC